MRYPINIILMIIVSVGIVTAIPYDVSDYSEIATGTLTQSITSICIATPITGYSPLNAQFTSIVLGGTGTYTYTWTFGDGTTSNSKTTTHTYNTAGTYMPTLKITDSNNNQATTSCGIIQAVQPVTPITATCTASPISGTAPLSTTLNVQVTGGAGIFAYIWDYGDGIIQTNKQGIQTHTYNTVGTYTPTIKIIDCVNNQITISCGTITADTLIQPLTATCTTTPINGFAPLNVAIMVSASGGVGPYSYVYDYGPNSVLSQNNIENYLYNDVGTYYPHVTVNDGNGNSILANCESVVVNDNPNYTLTADANGPYTGYIHESVTLDASASTSSLGIVSYNWDFGDGTIFESTTSTISHTYDKIGRQNVELTVYDIKGHTSIDTTTVTILERTNYSPRTYDDHPDKGIFIKQMILYGGYCETLQSDDDLTVQLKIENQWDRKLKSVRITVSIPELGASARSSSFDLSRGEDYDTNIILPLYDVAPGVYYVKISIDNDDNGEQVRRVKYREIVVKAQGDSCNTCCVAR
jgi:PKD repeat protein